MLCVAILLTFVMIFAIAIRPNKSADSGVTGGFPLTNNTGYSFGSTQASRTGWLIPANTTLETSFVTNQSLNHYIIATVNLIPYDMSQDTVLYLGLYVNGNLVANQTYDMSSYMPLQVSASVVGSVLNKEGVDLANFTHDSSLWAQVIGDLSGQVSSGANVTVLVRVSLPVWVETAIAGTATTYVLTSGSLGTSFPKTIAVDSAASVIAPKALSILVESDAS